MSATKTRILIVDDEERVREALSGQLERDGYTVSTAPDGQSAVARLRQEAWSILLVDLEMPGFDGLQVYELACEISPDATVLIMSAPDTVEQAVGAMKRGAYGYLVKPVDPDELSLAIKRIVTQQELVRENDALRRALRQPPPDGVPGTFALSLEEVERRHIAAVLESTGGNVSQAARILDIDRVTLYNKIRKYGLRQRASA